MRVLAGPPVVPVRRAPTLYAASGFSDVQTRDRQGLAAFTNVIEGALPFRYVEQGRLLTNSELWQAYRVCSEVRASVDGIVRVVSTWDWGVYPTIDPSDQRYERALEIAEGVRRFLAGPNKDTETWQEWVSKLTRDVLIFDALASENVTDSKGKLAELVALRGGDVIPVYDQKQRLQGYQQSNPIGQVVNFEPDQLLYMNLHPNTTSPGGVPLIESIINEIITLMRQSKHLMLAFDSDEIPPGILLLAGLAGKAAERAVASLRQMKGQDHKLRVLTTNNPQGISANWVELRHKPKELDMKDLVHQVRRVVWRVFGVKPVTMGDTESTPRATAEVQVDAQDSGLIRPFLELFEQKLNMRVVPLIVGDPALASLVAFEFDLGQKLSPKQQLEAAQRDASDMDRGALTVNERRAERGLPPVEHGDVPLVKTGGGYATLQDVVEGKAMAAPPPPPGKGPEDEKGEEEEGVTEPEANGPDEDDAAPAEADPDEEKSKLIRVGQVIGRARVGGSVVAARGRVLPYMPRARRTPPPSAGSMERWSRLPLLHGAACEPDADARGVRAADLPSDWQPEGKFKGKRTLDLGALGDAIVAYQREVGPLYRQARIDTVAAIRSFLGDGKISNDELPRAMAKVRDILDGLAVQWELTTEPLYRRAGKIGRDAAVKFTTHQVVEDWETRSLTYHQQAMRYLTGDRGLIYDLRSQINELLLAVVRAKLGVDSRADIDPTAVVDGVDVPMLLGAVRQIFDRNEHRTSNWGGKLVELSNTLLSIGMQEGSGKATSSDGTTKAVNWYYEWVSVGDDAMCPTCENEGKQDFRPVSTMRVQPGGETECRAKCRCVLVFWREDEVKSGKATRLSNYDAAA